VCRSLIAALLLAGAFGAAADCVHFEGGEVAAQKVRDAMLAKTCIVMQHVTIVGDYYNNGVLIEGAAPIIASDVTFVSEFDLPVSGKSFQCYHCKFEHGLSSFLSRMEDVELYDSEVNGELNFHSLDTEKLWLKESDFHGDAVFTASRIKDLMLADVKFERTVDFSGATIGSMTASFLRTEKPILISWQQFGPRMLADAMKWAGNDPSRIPQVETSLRFWQRNAAALNQNRDVADINYEILSLRRKHMMSTWSADWWASGIAGLPTRYGTRPFRPLWIALLCIGVFAVIYARRDPFVADGETPMRKQPLALFAIAWSVDTFLPFVEVTGAKKWGWRMADDFRWIEMTERVLGLLITSVAAYGIAAAFL